MATFAEVLTALVLNGVAATVSDDSGLRLVATEGVLTVDLLAEIRAHKVDIIRAVGDEALREAFGVPDVETLPGEMRVALAYLARERDEFTEDARELYGVRVASSEW